MNARTQELVREKEILVARSALCRLRLRRSAQEVRESLRWKRVAVAVASSPVMPPLVLGLAISTVGFDRVARSVLLAGRVLMVAKLACSFLGLARRQPGGTPPPLLRQPPSP